MPRYNTKTSGGQRQAIEADNEADARAKAGAPLKHIKEVPPGTPVGREEGRRRRGNQD
jgi:hypothetical protein